MWLISPVSSLASALTATLLQQWERRYVETPNVPSKPNHPARVRSYLFLGTGLYQMQFVSQLAFSRLHFYVCLFLAGLVMVFHGINIAIAVEVAVGVFGLACITLSILPCLDVPCPYPTPIFPSCGVQRTRFSPSQRYASGSPLACGTTSWMPS